jgi:hypothetical protein
MVALFVILTILVALLMDGLMQFKERKIQQQIFYHPSLGLTMADGGEEIKTPKESEDADRQ